MELYYVGGACSLAPHIVLNELGLPARLNKVDLGKGRTADGRDFKTVNPKGYVPALQLDNGEVLTEVAAILQYLVDQAPNRGLAPVAGTFERYRFIEWLTFVSSEIHKGFGPLWSPTIPAETRTATIEKLGKRFGYLDAHFAQNSFLMGETFTAADAYLFTVTNWAHVHKIDLSPYPKLQAYLQRVAGRPAVQAALETEGLVPKAA
jgi:glutathione S-transferase